MDCENIRRTIIDLMFVNFHKEKILFRPDIFYLNMVKVIVRGFWPSSNKYCTHCKKHTTHKLLLVSKSYSFFFSLNLFWTKYRPLACAANKNLTHSTETFCLKQRPVKRVKNDGFRMIYISETGLISH